MINKGEKVTVYRGNIRPAIVIILVVLVIHLIVLAIVVDEITAAFWGINGFLLILYALFFGIMAFQATQITLTVYENGVDWGRGTAHAFTTWDNIDAIVRKNEGDSATFGMQLRQPILPDGHRWLDRRFFAAPVDYIRLTPTVPVPTTFEGVQGNMIDWQAFAQTEFGQDLSRYAPRLLDHVAEG